MCGIAGVIQYKSEVPRHIRQRAIQILLTEMLLKTESRGRDATGLYQVMADSDWLMTKKAQNAENWLFQDRNKASCKDPYVYSDIIESWSEHDQELKAVIGHCRAKTVGSTDNENNHPFAIQVDGQNALLGVHNGTLYNHEKIFQKLPKIVERQGKVDSEAIFHLLYYLTEFGTQPITADVIKKLGARLDGGYACVVVNSLFPNQIITFRNLRPLEFFMVSPLNLILLASEKKIVESAVEKYRFVQRLLDPELPEIVTEDRTLPERDYRIFDTSLEFPKPLGNKLAWNDYNKISDGAEFRKHNDVVMAEWLDPTSPKPTGTTYGTSVYSGGGSGANSSAMGGKARKGGGQTTASAMPAGGAAARTTKAASTRAIPAHASSTKGSDETIDVEATVVEVEFGDEAETGKAYEQAPSLGAIVHYDTLKEIAKAIGKNQTEVIQMNAVDIANAISKSQFCLGYAMGRVDSKGEIMATRVKGKSLVKKLEDKEERLSRSEDKNKKAQNYIWSHKTLIQIMYALATGGYPVNIHNIDLVLRSFQKGGSALKNFSRLADSKRREVLDASKDILGSKDTEDLVGELHGKFASAEKSRKRKQQGSA